MISALNHLRRLNGNKFSLFLIIILSIASCKTTKDVPQRTRVPAKKERPETTPKEETKSTVIDKPTVVDKTDTQIVVDTPDAIDKKDKYNITILAPFDASRNLNDSSDDRFIMYYAGLKMAAEELSRFGAKMEINVSDTKNRSIDGILNASTDPDTDLIIGPYDRADLKYAVDYAKRQEIPLVSPWQSLRNTKTENPYYIQLSPYVTEYYHKLLKHISEKYNNDDVYVVGRRSVKSDVRRMAGLQKYAQAYYKLDKSYPLKEIYAEFSDLDGEDPVFAEKLNNGKPTVFLIPNWSGEDYEYTYNVLRRLSLEKGLNNVIVYGMFSMLDNTNITFELYNTLNIRVATPTFVDQDKYEVKKFKKEFLKKYGNLPTEDAYEGYDNFMLIGGSLFKYGKNFQYHLEKENAYYLQSSYEIFRNFGNIQGEPSIDHIQYFENKHIDLIEFKDGIFKRL